MADTTTGEKPAEQPESREKSPVTTETKPDPEPEASKSPETTTVVSEKPEAVIEEPESAPQRSPRQRRSPPRRRARIADPSPPPPRRFPSVDDVEVVVEEGSERARGSDSDEDGDLYAGDQARGRSAFFSGWRRFIPTIAYHHILMGLLVITVVLQSLLLSGCTSPTFRSNYIISGAYRTGTGNAAQNEGTARSEVLGYLRNATESVRLEVRTSFFKMCVYEPRAIQTSEDWTCGTFGRVIRRLQAEDSVDPLGLAEYMVGFSTEVIFYGLFLASIILCGVSFAGFATFPGWHEETDDDGSIREVKPFPSRVVSVLIMWSLGLATMFGFVSVIWMHMTAVAAASSLDFMFGDMLTTHVGWMPLFFGWLSVFLEAIVFVGMIVMIISIKLLDILTEEGDNNTDS